MTFGKGKKVVEKKRWMKCKMEVAYTRRIYKEREREFYMGWLIAEEQTRRVALHFRRTHTPPASKTTHSVCVWRSKSDTFALASIPPIFFTSFFLSKNLFKKIILNLNEQIHFFMINLFFVMFLNFLIFRTADYGFPT